MKYKVTGLIVCALIVIALFLSCEKNPMAPEATSEDEVTSEDLTLESTKTRSQGQVSERDLSKCCNDQVSSLKVGEYLDQFSDAAYVILYKDINYGGTPEIFIAEDPNFDGWSWRPGNKIGNDKVSSVRLLNGASCTLYSNSRFGGYKITLTENCPNLKKKVRVKVGWYTVTWNDCVSSIKVHGITAWGVVLYEQDHAGEYGSRPGRSETFLGSDVDLGNNNYIQDNSASMIKCVNLDGGMDVNLYKNTYFQNEIYEWW